MDSYVRPDDAPEGAPKKALKKRPKLRVVHGGGGASADPVLPDPDFIDPVALLERARNFREGSLATNTRSAYASDWAHFAAWCTLRGYPYTPADPDTVSYYLAAHAGTYAVSTLARRLVGISRIHRENKWPSPVATDPVRDTFAGIVRELGAAQKRAAPALTDTMMKILAKIDRETLLGKRDYALLLVGWFTARRASELVAFRVADLRSLGEEGYVLTLRRSKTDQRGEGITVGLPYGKTPESCSITALKAWLAAAGIKNGPLFRYVDRHGNVSSAPLRRQTVTEVVKRRVKAAGLDESEYSAHSLRAGLPTQARLDGADLLEIMEIGPWTSEKVARGYIRDADALRKHAAKRTKM